MSSSENVNSRIHLRHALYSALEAAVRENHHGAGNNTYNKSGRFTGSDGEDNGEDGGDGTASMPAMEYPSPLLWFEEITPADLDAYHASHRPINRTRKTDTRDGSGIRQSATGVVFGRIARAADPSQTPALSDGPTNDDGECREQSWKSRNAMMAREEGLRAEHERAAGQGPESASLFPCPSGRVDINESICDNDVDTSIISPTLTAWTPTAKGSAAVREYDNRSEPTETSRDISKTRAVASALLVTPATPATQRTQTTATPTTNAVYECDSRQEKSSQQPRRTKSTTAALDSTVSIPARHAGGPTQPPTSLATDAAHQHITVTQRQEHQRTSACQSSQPHSERSMAGSAAGTGPGAAHSEMFLPPSQLALSQQSALFSHSLPSQVVLTQQGNDMDSFAWQQEEGDDEETPESEYDHSMPSAPSSLACAAMPPNSDLEEVEAMEADCADRGRATRASSASGRDHVAAAPSASRVRMDDPWGDGRCPEETSMSTRNGHQARVLEHQAFTQALEQRFGDHEGSRGSECKSNWQSGGDGLRQQESRASLLPSSSRNRRRKQRMIMVPTAEVLPSGIRGGQVGAVSLLEKNLTRVREKGVPEGYGARALEVACHVLRQPTVCVSVDGGSDGNDHEIVRAWQQRNAAEPVSDGHAQVVGITGIVWEILCAAADRRQ